MLNSLTRSNRFDRRTFAALGDGAGAGAGDPPPADAAAAAAAAAASNPPPAGSAAKWWEGERFADPARNYLTAKGLTVDDPMEAMPKLIDIAANAEKRIGKGLDSIIDKPGKDQAYTDWVAANRAALGLPADEAGYQVAQPEGWPKEAQWDTAREGKAKAIALKYGIPKEGLQELVNLQAEAVMEMSSTATALTETAKRELMADLERDYGAQTPAVIQKARQGAEAVATKAGLSTEHLANLSDALMDKIGDANVIRFMAAIGDMISDDGAVGLGKGGALTTTPAEARAELAALRAPGGAYYDATAKNDRAAIERIKPKLEMLTRIAAGG